MTEQERQKVIDGLREYFRGTMHRPLAVTDRMPLGSCEHRWRNRTNHILQCDVARAAHEFLRLLDAS